MKNKLIMILLLLCLEIPLAWGYMPNDIEWAPATEATLYKGNNFTNGPYTVVAAQFPAPVPGYKNFNKDILPETPVSPMVYVEIYKNGAFMKDIVLTLQGSSYIDPDHEVKVSLTDILPGTSRDWVMEYYKPWAKVSISLRGKPEFELEITTDKTNYISSTDEIMTATFKVKNKGYAVARNVRVDVNPGVLQLRGGNANQFHPNFLEIKKGETQSFVLILIVPKVVLDTSYTLDVKSIGYDVKDLEYQGIRSLMRSVLAKDLSKEISVSKAIKDRIYLKDTSLVRVTVSNGGDHDIYNVKVTDKLNNNFELKFDSPTYWEIPVIKSGQDWSTTYSLRPLESSLEGFPIPAVNALFTINNKEYNSSSDSPSVIVNGPKIILNKTINKKTVNISEDITITVSIKNIGNIATRTQVIDYLPDDVSLVSGQTSTESLFLEVNKPQGFSYVIRPRLEGKIELPSAEANYMNIEYKGIVRSALSSERVIINVIDPNKINTQINFETINKNSKTTQSDGKIPITLPDTTPSTEGTSGNSPENSLEITPTPITPFINTGLSILMLIFAAILRRK
ncbi:MAG: BatD family protein [Candidatus Methanoperedens sp.]|nr:BatD family protein [Candidatus Methanoperedens sp.]